MDEIRAGFHTRTFDRLLRREILGRTDVNSLDKYERISSLVSSRNNWHFRFFTIIIAMNFI